MFKLCDIKNFFRFIRFKIFLQAKYAAQILKFSQIGTFTLHPFAAWYTVIFFLESAIHNYVVFIFFIFFFGISGFTISESRVNPCESQSEIYISYVKSLSFSKIIKFWIEVAEDPQKHIFKVNFRLCVAIGKIVFFQKAETFLHRFTAWHFFLRSIILTKNDWK